MELDRILDKFESCLTQFFNNPVEGNSSTCVVADEFSVTVECTGRDATIHFDVLPKGLEENEVNRLLNTINDAVFGRSMKVIVTASREIPYRSLHIIDQMRVGDSTIYFG